MLQRHVAAIRNSSASKRGVRGNAAA